MLAWRYAQRELLLFGSLGVSVTVLVAAIAGGWALVPAVVTLALLAFFRDPVRRPPIEPDVVLAPADGRIVEVRSVREATGLGAGPTKTVHPSDVLRIDIFLSVLDVHINRSPCAATVRQVTYSPGRFRSALRRGASGVNEANTLILDPAPPLPGPIQVRQIAGLIARRIVCQVQPGECLAAGAAFGMLKFGSRTQLLLSRAELWEVCVQEGQHVRAGETIIARLRSLG